MPSIQWPLNIVHSRLLEHPQQHGSWAISATSRLVVLATEKEMEAVDTLLAELDLAPKQILIEARLLGDHVYRTHLTIKGIDWSATELWRLKTFPLVTGKQSGMTETLPGGRHHHKQQLPCRSGRTVTESSRYCHSCRRQSLEADNRPWPWRIEH